MSIAASVTARNSIFMARCAFALLLALFAFWTSAQAADTQTPPTKIDAVQVNTGQYALFNAGGTLVAYYLVNKTGWGAPGCETANIVRIVNKDLYDIAFYAYAAGRNVVVYGQCFNAQYFIAGAILIPALP